MKLTDFERVVCLCVDHRVKTELPRLTKMVADRGHTLTPFIVGKGKVLPLAQYDFTDPTGVPPTWRGYHNSYCAFRAYQKIFRTAIKDKVASVLILEDDCQFTGEFDEVIQQVETPERWDMLYLGGNYQSATSTLVSPFLYRTVGVMCWHGVGINQSVFEDIVNWIPCNPIDYQCVSIHRKGNTYGVFPNIAIQKPGMSFVEGRYRDYTRFWNIHPTSS